MFRMIKSKLFLFCPTVYCMKYAEKTNTTDYLITVGTSLMVGIDIMWTGDNVISKNITADSLGRINSIFRRSVVIWDNLHSNDSRRNMLNLGPYSLREKAILDVTRGIFLNPNTEFDANTVPIITFSKWINSAPQDVFKEAQLAWMSDLNCSTEDQSSIVQELAEVDSSEPMEIDRFDYVSTADISFEDVESFSDFFYLPFEFSHAGKELLTSYQWLVENYHKSTFPEWKDRMESLLLQIRDIEGVLSRFSLIPNRVILRQLIPYIYEFKWTIQHVAVLVTWIGLGKFSMVNIEKTENSMELESVESINLFGSFMIINELKMIQPTGYLFDLNYVPTLNSSRDYKIFVYDHSYHDSVLEFGTRWYTSHWSKDVEKISALCLEGMLTLQPHLVFVLCDITDELTVVGFAMACSNLEDYKMKFRMAFGEESEDLRAAYPSYCCIATELRDGDILTEDSVEIKSLMRLCVLDDLSDPNAVLHLFDAMSVALQFCGIDQVAVEIGAHDMSLISLISDRLCFSNVMSGSCCYNGNIRIYSRTLP